LNLCKKYLVSLIASNQIKDEGANSIGKGLKNNTTLAKLDLGNKYNI
jgi:hypothetical protein